MLEAESHLLSSRAMVLLKVAAKISQEETAIHRIHIWWSLRYVLCLIRSSAVRIQDI